jgi:hypothetical protein
VKLTKALPKKTAAQKDRNCVQFKECIAQNMNQLSGGWSFSSNPKLPKEKSFYDDLVLKIFFLL